MFSQHLLNQNLTVYPVCFKMHQKLATSSSISMVSQPKLVAGLQMSSSWMDLPGRVRLWSPVKCRETFGNHSISCVGMKYIFPEVFVKFPCHTAPESLRNWYFSKFLMIPIGNPMYPVPVYHKVSYKENHENFRNFDNFKAWEFHPQRLSGNDCIGFRQL